MEISCRRSFVNKYNSSAEGGVTPAPYVKVSEASNIEQGHQLTECARRQELCGRQYHTCIGQNYNKTSKSLEREMQGNLH